MALTLRHLDTDGSTRTEHRATGARLARLAPVDPRREHVDVRPPQRGCNGLRLTVRRRADSSVCTLHTLLA